MQQWMQAMMPAEDEDLTAATSKTTLVGRHLAKVEQPAPPHQQPPTPQDAGGGESGQAGDQPGDFFYAVPGKDCSGGDAFAMPAGDVEEVKRLCRSRGHEIFVVAGEFAWVKMGSMDVLPTASDQPQATLYVDFGSQFLGKWTSAGTLDPGLHVYQGPGLGLRVEMPGRNFPATDLHMVGTNEAEFRHDDLAFRLRIVGYRAAEFRVRPGQQSEWSNPEPHFMHADFSGTWAGPAGLVVIEQSAASLVKVLFFGSDGGLLEAYAGQVRGSWLNFEGPGEALCSGRAEPSGQTIHWNIGPTGELPLIGSRWGKVEAGFRAHFAQELKMHGPPALRKEATDLSECVQLCGERGFSGFTYTGTANFRDEPAEQTSTSVAPAELWKSAFVRLTPAEEETLGVVWSSAAALRVEAGSELQAERSAWSCDSSGFLPMQGESVVDLFAKAKRRALKDIEASWTSTVAASFQVSFLDPHNVQNTRRVTLNFLDALRTIYFSLSVAFSGTEQAEPVRAFWRTACLCFSLLVSCAGFHFHSEAGPLFQSSVDLLLEVFHITQWANVGALLSGDGAGLAQAALRRVVSRLVVCLREAFELKLEVDEEEEEAALKRLDRLAVLAEEQPAEGADQEDLPETVEFWRVGRGRGTRLFMELSAALAGLEAPLRRLKLLEVSRWEAQGCPGRGALVAGRRGVFGGLYDVLERYGFEPGLGGVRELARHLEHWAREDSVVQSVTYVLMSVLAGAEPDVSMVAAVAEAAAAAERQHGAKEGQEGEQEGELMGEFTLARDDYTSKFKDFGRYRIFVRATAPKGAGFHVCVCSHSEVGHLTPTLRIARALVARDTIGRVTFATNAFGARKVRQWLREEPDATGKLELVGFEDGWSQETQDESNAMAQAGDGTLVMTVALYAEQGMLPFLESFGEQPGGRPANEPDCWLCDLLASGAVKAITERFHSNKPLLVSAPLSIVAYPTLPTFFPTAQTMVHCFTLPKELRKDASFGDLQDNALPVGMFAGPPGKALPQDLLDFLEMPGPPVVYVSMGSQGSFTKEQLLQVCRGLFAPGEWRVLWSLRESQQKDLPGGGPEGLGPDFMVRKWLPQADLLRHPRVAAFVSHCGWGATSEAILSGTPVVALPLFAEQMLNAYMLEIMGMARIAHIKESQRSSPQTLLHTIAREEDPYGYVETLQAEDVKASLRAVLGEQSFQKAAEDALLHASLFGDGAERAALEIERRCRQPEVAAPPAPAASAAAAA